MKRGYLIRITVTILLGVVSIGSLSAYADEQTTVIDVAPQPLAAALNSFSEQTGVQFGYVSNVADGVESRGTSGEASPRQALDSILAETGLTYSFINDTTVFIAAVDSSGKERREGATQRGDSDLKNASPQTLVLAQNGVSRMPAERKRRGSADVAVGTITGTVTDARTGARLKGALLSIEETGQSTSTNDLGEYRFTNVPVGHVTILVSYLGYAGQTAAAAVDDRPAFRDFALSVGDELEEIVVFGQRSARALALNIERTAENSTTVLSADLLGQFEGATLAETLRRAPGIAFQEDPLTGDGTNVIVRGLSPDFNQIRLDGQRLAEGSGLGRSPAIGNLLADSIDEVIISKTLLPSQDSNGAGGLIEISTKGPLDRSRRFAQFSVEFGANDGFEDNQQYSGVLSGTFGEDDGFGLSLSVQHREESKETVTSRYQIDQFGQYLPPGSDGNPVTSIRSLDPRSTFPFEDGVDRVYPRNLRSYINNVDTETSAGTLTAEWRPFDHSNWRLSYTRTEQDVDSTRRRLSFSQFSRHLLLPVDELGGEVRGAHVWEGSRGAGAPDLPLAANRVADAEFATDVSDVLSFQGETRIDRWSLNYRLSRSEGKRNSIGYQLSYWLSDDFIFDLPREFVAPEALGETVDGRLVSLFAPRRPNDESYVLPRLTDAGFAFFNDPANYSILTSDEIDMNPSSGENLRESAMFSLRRDFASANLSYLELGLEYEGSRFDNSAPTRFDYVPLSNLTLADLGISRFGGDILSSVGIDGGFLSVTDAEFRRLIQRLDALSSGPNPLLNLVEFPTTGFFNEGSFTDEDELAIYLQGRIDIGDFDIVGGVRYSKVDVAARQFSTPVLIREDGTPDIDFAERNRTLVDQGATQSVYLPRIALNYRPRNNIAIRGAYFQTFSRPRIESLSARQIVSLDLRERYGAGGDQPQLSVSQGNPDLKPSLTHSYDLSVEMYDDNAGVLELGLFYKNIENFIEFNQQTVSEDLSGVSLPDIPELQDLPDNISVRIRQPLNSDDRAEIYGAELNVERRFVQLPGIWGGLGIYANYTYSKSEKFFVFDDFFDPLLGEFVDIEVSGVSFDQSPRHSGTFAVTYNKYGIDASITYTAQSERQRDVQPNGLSRYDGADQTLDMRFEYQFERGKGTWRAFVAGTDLLKGTDDPDTLTYLGESSKYYNSGTFFGGRTFSAGVSAVF